MSYISMALILLILLFSIANIANAFVLPKPVLAWSHRFIAAGTSCSSSKSKLLQSSAQDQEKEFLLIRKNDDVGEEKDVLSTPLSSLSSSYDTSDSSSKGIVSSLTGIVNYVMGRSGGGSDTATSDEEGNNEENEEQLYCTTPQQLMDKIRDDYVKNNYLWTGDIFLPAFEADCQFTDPTLSFVGRDKFVSNVQNLQPIVDFLVGENQTVNDVCESALLDIDLNLEKGYVESRWNMVGQLNALPWKPKIDVIGRTKFWYRGNANGDTNGDDATALRVYFYDEQWEMPAFRALLQLVTPAGTITNKHPT